MKLLLLGPPGAGKGTQAKFIAKEYAIPHISTGDMLRAAISSGSELGHKVKATIDAGHLVSDDLMIEIVKERLAEADCAKGYLLDGFPRTIAQADALVAHDILLDQVIVLTVPDSEIIERLSGRRVHLPSGRSYHIHSHPPKQEGMDDETGEPLTHRDDDKAETIAHRLSVYHDVTEPLIQYYQNITSKLDGTQTVEQVRAAIVDAISVAQS